MARSVLLVSLTGWTVHKSLQDFPIPIHLFEPSIKLDHILVLVALALLDIVEATLYRFDTMEDFLDSRKRYATRSYDFRRCYDHPNNRSKVNE